MIYIVTNEEAKQADIDTIKRGTPSLELMERAGRGIFEILQKRIEKNKKILIIAGLGGNGGDGFVLGRYLFEDNYDVSIYPLDGKENEERKINRELYKGKITDKIDNYDYYIDAIFGIGLQRKISEPIYSLISKINNYPGYKVAIDIPSGINGTTGEIMTIAFKADLVITIQNVKIGMLQEEAKKYYKELEVLDVAIHADDESNFKIYNKN